MKADPRISEIDAIARARRIPDMGTALHQEERWLMVACALRERNDNLTMMSIILEVPQLASATVIRDKAQREAACSFGCAPDRVFVILEDLFYA